MNLLGPSWKTTLTGVIAVLSSITHIADSMLNNKPVDWTVAMTGIMTGIGLIFARDNRVSTEQALGTVPPKP